MAFSSEKVTSGMSDTEGLISSMKGGKDNVSRVGAEGTISSDEINHGEAEGETSSVSIGSSHTSPSQVIGFHSLPVSAPT